jgi:phosphatidylglycerol---prolipoprotein diacylglyceryl transferase
MMARVMSSAALHSALSSGAQLAAIPYTTFPTIDVGPFELRTFGIAVGLGIVVGVIIAARWGEEFGIQRDDTIALGTRMVIAGVIASRLTWVITHTDQIDSPIDVIAVWEGGLQFSGGFLGAIAVGIPSFRRWSRYQRWRLLDGMALGLTVGMAIGRIGCYAVGEHLGGSTSFFLGVRYDGGDTREGPLVVGEVIHNTALYEIVHLIALALLLVWLMYRRNASPGTAMGIFLAWYGAFRFGTDFLRSYDDTVLGLTGAQWMCLGLLATAVWVLVRVRPQLAGLSGDDVDLDADGPPAEVTGGPSTPTDRP